MDIPDQQELDLRPQLIALLVLLLGTLFLLAFMVMLAVSPLYALLMALAVLCAGGAVAVFGGAGALAVIPIAYSFLLMVRFDEGLALPISGDIKMKAVYWLSLPLLAALAFVAVCGKDRPAWPSLRTPLLWLALIALAGMLLNRVFDFTLGQRNAAGELLAIGAILLPPLFAIWLPRSGLSMVRTRWCLRAVIFFGGLAGFIMSMFGLLPGSVVDALGWTETSAASVSMIRGRLPLGHPNTVASIMLLLFPAVIILGLGDQRLRWRLFYLGCALLIFSGTLFALSRGALLCMTFTGALSLLYLWSTWHGVRRVLGAALIGLFVLGLAGTALLLFSRLDFSRFWSRGYHEDASVERRLDSMGTAARVFLDHPLCGITPDALDTRLELRPGWEPVLSDEISPVFLYQGRTTAETPHNFYLMLLAEFGLLGALCFLWLLYRTAAPLWRARRLAGLRVHERRALTAFLLGIMAFLLIGMFEAVLLTSLRANIVFWVYIGLALRYAWLLEQHSASGPPDGETSGRYESAAG